MAMGFSSQTGPFRPSRPPLFRCSSSCLRSSSLASHFSHFFWDSSRKALHREGDCAYHNVAGSLYNMVVSFSSSEFKQGSSCNTMSFEENYRQDNMKFYDPSTRWNLKVPTKTGNPPILLARMLPDLPNQINSKGGSISSDLGSLQRPEEEKKIGGSDSSAAKHLWLEEGERLRCIRLRDMKMEAITNSGKVDIDMGTRKPSHEFIVKSEENASSVAALINVDTVSCISIDAKCSQTDNNLRNSAQSNAGNGVPRISASPHHLIGQLKFLSGKDKRHDRITKGRVLPKSDSAEQNYRTNNTQTHKLRCKFNVRSEENAGLVPALINGDASCISTDAKVSHTDNNYRKSVLPSKLISRNSPQSNAGNGVPHISTALVESVGQEVIFFGNRELRDGINKGHVVLKSASAEQNYRRNRNNNMSHNNSGVPLVDSTQEQVLSSTQTFLEGLSSKRLAEKGVEINSKQLDEDATNVLQNNIARKNVLNVASVKPGNRPTPLKRLLDIYDKVLVVDNISTAREIVKMITNQYKHCVHACDTEVANIDVKQETPVDHGEIICFSIYSGPEADFGDGKSCIWVDVLDGGGKSILVEFAPFFEDPDIKKVWHNYSFDKHVIENYGIRVSGFHADTMHMARLWDSSRRTQGGYSLEALTSDPKVCGNKNLISKVSMKTIFGRRKVKKDGSEGKIITIPPVEELQRQERKPWICYSALDSRSTLELYEYLKRELSLRHWILNGDCKGSMLDFYEKHWRPFGKLLVEMETKGMLVDRAYLAEMEKVAQAEQRVAAKRFRSWASKYCPDAKFMNVGSDAQLRQLFFGGIQNRKDPNESLPLERDFKVPNVEKVIEEGKKKPTKFRNIKLHRLVPEKNEEVPEIETEMYTATGWPSVSGDALKTLAGKVSAEFDIANDSYQLQLDDNIGDLPETQLSGAKAGAVSEETESAYGTAYAAFGGDREGKEACHAIAALCDVCSIDSLISNFILPLQGSHISGSTGRIHCSLNINTETGRLSARRPNLQNQPALEKDRYKIRQAFIAAPGNSLIVADYGQLELRILAHLANCKSMLDAFKAGGDFHSRTAMNMYPHIREAVEQKHVLLEWHPQPGEEKPPVPLLKDAFGSERRKAKMLNFSIAYGKTPVGLAHDWKVSVKEAKETVNRWYNGRQEVRAWQEERKKEARQKNCVHTLLGRARWFPSTSNATRAQKGHIERAAINTPVQGSAADVAMCAMLEISKNARLKELGWTLLLQVHDEVILEGPRESAEDAKAIVIECMSKPFDGKNILKVDLPVDAKCAQNWYSAK